MEQGEEGRRRTGASRKVGVIYLARSADGNIDGFTPFVESYRRHPAGIDHELIIVRKGLEGMSGSIAALEMLLENIPHRSIDVSDEGYDIQAYLKVAPRLEHERLCFLNTYSEIKTDDWLKKLDSQLDREGVGIVGATASYESLYDSIAFISKAIWLAVVKKIPFNPALARQFGEQLSLHAPKWMTKGRRWHKRIRSILQSRGLTGDDYAKGFADHWDAVTAPDQALYLFRQFKRFPNPHLRSNAFMMRRDVLLDLGFQLDDSKNACVCFESGPDGLPARLAERGLRPVLVGADGRGYEVPDWPLNNGFRIGDQSNVMIWDNQVRNFAAMSASQRHLHARMSWGDYLQGSLAGFEDLGFRFARGDLCTKLVCDAVEAASSARSRPFFSLVIPTHNRLALLRQAVESIMRQGSADWECVVFDNASEEPLGDYVRSLGDKRIRYERSDTFLPVTDSWNRAIDHASGTYVMLIGDDDGLTPNFVERLRGLVDSFGAPDVVYSSIYQFFHPGVAPWERAGYVANLKNAFFLAGRAEPFVLSWTEARKAVAGSLNVRRNFTFNMQAFTFSRAFLARLRMDGAVFHSPFPDYYLANMAMGMADKVVVVPEPLTIAGVSRASFGFTLFNGLEQEGADLLNTKLVADPLYEDCAARLLPGPAYNTNYILTMAHVAGRLGEKAPADINFRRYRRMQIQALIRKLDDPLWMRSAQGRTVWRSLSLKEKGWAAQRSLYYWQSKNGGRNKEKSARRFERGVTPYGFAPILESRVVGRFADLPELFDALEAGTYA